MFKEKEKEKFNEGISSELKNPKQFARLFGQEKRTVTEDVLGGKISSGSFPSVMGEEKTKTTGVNLKRESGLKNHE